VFPFFPVWTSVSSPLTFRERRNTNWARRGSYFTCRGGYERMDGIISTPVPCNLLAAGVVNRFQSPRLCADHFVCETDENGIELGELLISMCRLV
jgi:hypothetical protein